MLKDAISIEQMFNRDVLSLFAGSKYICVVFNRSGQPVDAINTGFHNSPVFLGKLRSNRIDFNYDIPSFGDLNDLFSEESPFAKSFALDEKRLERLEKLFGNVPSLSFNSKNILERESEHGNFYCAHPLSTMRLFRLSEDSFLAIIIMRSLLYQLEPFNDGCFILSTGWGKIIGYSETFANIIGLTKPESLLCEKIDTLIPPGASSGIARPVDHESSESRESVVCKWNAGEPLDNVLVPLGTDPCTMIRAKEDCLEWENTSESRFSYLRIKETLPGVSSFTRFVFEYESDNVTMPNIMMWASEFANDNQQPDYFPDAKGYNFSRTVLHGRGQFLLKKKTHRCAYWPDEKITREGTIKVELIKHGDIFSVICQGINLGSWRDKYPVSDGENNLAYLFLRPKSRVVLKSFAIYTADVVDRQRGGNLTGAYPVTMNFGSVRTHFYVNELAIASSETIMRLYLLTDVTAITSGLEKLKSQKKQMASLIRYKDGFVGRSDGIMEIRGTMTVVAKSNLSVLIEGETGTGKEVLARAIHSASPRKDMPFVKIDCTAFPEGLIESELFGHVKGAFTGAVYDRIGRMEQAQGGTVFLDEIGNLPLSVQAKLLGVLQDYSVQRVGATGSKTLDIRVIAATNAPLQRYITEGRFREDLFYRLNQYRYLLPPLRERREDIPVLAELFLEEANAFYNKSVAEISPEVVKVLYDAPWPGNVRQLRSVILRAALFCDTSVLDGTSILMDDLYPAQPLPHANEAGVMRKQEHTRKKRCRRLEVDKEHFMRMAEECGGNYTKLAEVLKLSRPSVYKLLKKWNIQRLG